MAKYRASELPQESTGWYSSGCLQDYSHYHHTQLLWPDPKRGSEQVVSVWTVRCIQADSFNSVIIPQHRTTHGQRCKQVDSFHQYYSSLASNFAWTDRCIQADSFHGIIPHQHRTLQCMNCPPPSRLFVCFGQCHCLAVLYIGNPSVQTTVKIKQKWS